MKMPLQIVTHNINGFDSKSHFVSDLCSALPSSIYCLQEHWLLPPYKKYPGVNKLKSVHPDLDGWGRSAMKNSMETRIRHGRPYGGTGFLWTKGLSSAIKPMPEYLHERVTVLKVETSIGSLIIVNVYMPYFNANDITNQTTLYSEVLAFVGTVMNDNPHSKFIVLGDMNCNLYLDNPFSNLLNSLIRDHRLVCTYDLNPVFDFSNEYTRCNHKQGSYTLLDYILISEELISFVNSIEILNNALNTSDHLPVKLSLEIDIVSSTPKVTTSSLPSVVDWKRVVGDVRVNYENVMEECLNSISVPISLHDDCICNDTDHISSIEKYYLDIVKSIYIADLQLPKCTPSLQKTYWNEQLTILKNDSITAHEYWKISSFPRTGPIFEAKKQSHYAYKLYLRKCQSGFNQSRMDSLNEDLVAGHQNKFWNSYKHFNYSNSKTTSYIDGLNDDSDIANCFASNFKHIYETRNVEKSNKLKSEFLTMYESYSLAHQSDSISPMLLSFSDMLSVVSKLKTGKSSASFVKAEHLLNGSPKLVVHLHILFNAMILHSYVPTEFLNGVITPLIKDSEGNHSDPNNYRGLTLGVVFSYLFEHALLLKVGHLLTTDNLQFGYKQKHSISHAIFTLRSCIEFFTSRGSNVIAAFLDCSKGFDKIDHSAIFMKLMQRNIPLCALNLMIYWYSNLSSVVKWNNAYSYTFSVRSGVRQGGVLSPRLFTVYLDDLFRLLKESNVGCYIKNLFVAAIIYADDICLLAPCRSALQTLLNICEGYGLDWCLTYNPSKSKTMIFGSSITIKPLTMYNRELEVVDELRYLGVSVVSGKQFSVGITSTVRKFRCASNTILNAHRKSSEPVLLKLIYAVAVPILTYACETLPLNCRQLNEMTVALNDVIRRVFSFNRWESVRHLRESFGYSSLTEIVYDSTERFFKMFSRTDNATLITIKAVIDA